MNNTKTVSIKLRDVNDGAATLTKREHFAAMTLQGIIAQWSHEDDRAAAKGGESRVKWAARSALEAADALIEALADENATNEQDEIEAEMAVSIRNAIEDSLARNLSMCTVTMVNVANGHKTEMVDLHEVRAMHEATAANLAMVIAELVRR